jgi:hypothetical protein
MSVRQSVALRDRNEHDARGRLSPRLPPHLADVGALTGNALRDVGHRAGLILDADAQLKELDAVRHGVIQHLLQPGRVDVAAAEEGHDPFDVPVAEGHEGSVVHR